MRGLGLWGGGVTKDTRTVVVLGVPRSGTSATAGMLEILGVNMGDCEKRDELNPCGYYEDKDFMLLLHRVCDMVGREWNGFTPLDPESVLAYRDKVDGDVRDLVDKRTQNADAWGWKAPLTGPLFDLFAPYLTNPYFVVVLRNPMDVALSCQEYTRVKDHLYEPLSFIEALQIMNFYLHHIFATVARYSEIPTLYLSYRDIVTEPEATLRKMAQFLDMPIQPGQLRAACDFVRRE